jgi:anaerobic magnesium-protoporphyrin IX monomethyl ester cyclase
MFRERLSGIRPISMKILILNPPHLSIGSRLAGEHLPPLGLLSIGGPLIDVGHEVQLYDADYYNSDVNTIFKFVNSYKPEILLIGHSGSTSAQPIINFLTKEIKHQNNKILIILGGVFPTFHWKEILSSNIQIDYIVKGEGEHIVLELIGCIDRKIPTENVLGIAFTKNGIPFSNQDAPLIEDIDQYRIGWELMNGYNYTYWGKKKAVVIQFSRGCPYPCTYCGQSIFWKKWRHRNPQKLVDEIEMLHYKYGIEVINFADENPSSVPKAWRTFLEILSSKNLNLILVGSIRSDNVVRDKDFLHLYKKAGFERLLLGIENYSEETLKLIKKSGSKSKDMEAIQLLRKHDILSMATLVVGFGEEKTSDYFYNLKQLLQYDPDQIQLLYATPHHWTPYFDEVKNKKIINLDQTQWDYKHQILESNHLKSITILIYVKLIEVIMQTRPKALIRLFFHKDKRLRKAMKWYSNIGKRVWFFEIYSYLKNLKNEKRKPLLDFWKS